MIPFTPDLRSYYKHLSIFYSQQAFAPLIVAVLLGSLGCIRIAPPTESAVKGIEAQSLAGYWAKKSVFTSKMGALGISVKNSVTKYTLLHLAVVEGRLEATEKVCEIKTKVPLTATLKFPQALIDSLTDLRYHYDLPDNTGKLSMPKAVELVGVKLKNPETDPLIEKNGAVFYDQDQDGNPGVTVDVGASIPMCGKILGHVYIAQRAFWSEEGTWESSEKASGHVDFRLTQKVLGANTWILRGAIPATTPIKSESFFEMDKLPEGKGSCEHVYPEDRSQEFSSSSQN